MTTKLPEPKHKAPILNWLAKWRFQFQTMVRYRLLVLTSAPIILTLMALIGITIYWSIHYTWNSALIDVSERLGAARQSVELIQKGQNQSVKSFVSSYEFQKRLREQGNTEALVKWVATQSQNTQLDYLRYIPADTPKRQLAHLDVVREDAFFDVLSLQQLHDIDPALAQKAAIAELDSDNIERRGLVIRSVIRVRAISGEVVGFIDGGLLLNNSTALVDELRDILYSPQYDPVRPTGTMTIFLDDLRVSTNVPLDSSEKVGRAIGSRVSDSVKETVLQGGEQWVDEAYVHDAWYISAYQPIRDRNDQVIGMFYTGYLLWPFVKTYFTTLVEIGVVTLGLLLISGLMVYRGSRDLFRPIERIHRVVKLIQLGKQKRIGELGLDPHHELAQLAKQFDAMLDLLDKRQSEIEEAAVVLEDKVQQRTASLKEKTQQLEFHISLLNQTRDKLVTSEKLAALGGLTAGIAHEINNPTAVILGNVELLKFELGEDASKVEEEVDAILAQIDRIRNITKSLLQYSRQGGIQDEITWQYVNPIIDESITLVKAGAKRKEIVFVRDFQAHTSVEVNRHQLLQILVNLQVNAIHAMQGKGELIIRSRDWNEGGEILGAVIEIQDQGSGIKPEQLKRIFDPFYTTKREGTGLGLSVSQSLISQTGGEIRVESEWGKGSCFSVFLPKKSGATLEVNTLEL
ncbi:two-component sensor histidine kinase [Vibrio astriarenae]|uniref:histidine kinase n=1 Tax=Vibrio astriarenae TaxID=1481923 RepID=A0A7Z2T7K2_9VIBR|nr:cache domain-containing protein [Vibrio astriarenae]QIA65818.1 two-component sensor histidine kinase [Vibrio astriarenae]